MHLFGHKFDHDYYFELLREEERAAHSINRCFAAHHRLFRAGPRANRTLGLLVIPSFAPHPVESNRQSPRHRYLGDLASSPYHQVGALLAPLWKTAHCALEWN